jgi:hypothetical protein
MVEKVMAGSCRWLHALVKLAGIGDGRDDDG